MKKPHLIIMAVTGFILAVIIFVNPFSKNSTSVSTAPYLSNSSNAIEFGEKEAVITITEYSSFECPNCKMLHHNIKEFLESYIQEGKIRYIFKHVDIKHFPYDQVIYTNLTEKDMNSFDKLHEIYEKQDEWKKAKNEEKVLDILQLSQNEIVHQNKRKEQLQSILQEVEKLQITEVPTFYINGTKFVGVYSEEEIRQFVEKELSLH